MCVSQAVTTKMSRIHAIMNGTAPLHSLQHEKGHVLANSPSAASLSRRLSQVSMHTNRATHEISGSPGFQNVYSDTF